MDSLKSFDIQLTDIWIECQKEMIEMRNKIMNLSDCLKTSELINRHLSKCNETLFAIVEKCSLDHKNSKIIVLIDFIKEEEKCVEREKQNLRTFETNLNNNKVNDKRVFELIKVWNQCKPKRALTEDKAIQTINNCFLNQIQSLDQISDKRSVDCIEECNERPKRHRKVISYKALNEEIDITDKEVDNKEREENIEVNETNHTFDDINSLIITNYDSIDTQNNYNYSDEEFECKSEAMTDSDNEYSLEKAENIKTEAKVTEINQILGNKSKSNRIKDLIYDRIANNDCVIEIDKSNEFKIIFSKTDDSVEFGSKRTRIGFGCTWSGCNFVNNNKSKILRHIDSVHKNRKPFKCNECSYTSTERLALKRHIDCKHINDSVDYECDVSGCQYRTKSLSHFESHKRSKRHVLNKKSITVADIRKLIDSNQTTEHTDKDNDLIKIIRYKSESNPKQNYILGYGCKWGEECEYLNGKKDILKRHIEGKHQNIKRFVCDKCEFKTTNNRSLNTHLLEMHDINRAQADLLWCDWNDCQYKTNELNKLRKHKNKHSGHKPHKCHWPSCEFATHSKASLTSHIRIHNNERPFACEWPGCDWKFRTKLKLKEHRFVHNEHRLFKCNWPGCEASFRTRQPLSQHQVVHTKNKRFACTWPECESAFRDANGLRQHLLIHNDIKPITCLDDDCGQRFRVKTQMIIHFKLKHQNKLHLLDK